MKITYAPLPVNRNRDNNRDNRAGGPGRKDAPKRDVFSRLGSRYVLAETRNISPPLFSVPLDASVYLHGERTNLTFDHYSEAGIASRLGKLNPLPKTLAAGQGSTNQRGGNNRGRQSGGGASSSAGSGKSGQPKEKKKQPVVKSAEELDAEMDTYMGDVSL